MSLTYNANIPAAGNNPSSDQNPMQTNFASNNTIWGRDHYDFKDANAGRHQLITLPARVVPGNQADPASAIYSSAGTASTISELFYKSQNGVFLLNAIKAFGNFSSTTTNGASSFNNSMNLNSIVVSNSGVTYTIVVTSGAVNSTHPIIIPFYNKTSPVSITYAWTQATNTLVFTTVPATNAIDISFIMIEI